MGYLYIRYHQDWIKCNWILALEKRSNEELQVKWYNGSVTTFYELTEIKVEPK